MRPKLISFKLCPFVQRAAIVLNHKMIEHDIEYIDLVNPPDWFLELSPLKKVPLLLVDGQMLFESSVINEYLDDAYPIKLHPADLILRAKNRAWIEHGSECMMSVFYLSVKATEQEFITQHDELQAKFDPVEKALYSGPYFNGKALSLVDASYAPLLQRLDYLDEIRPGIFDAARHPQIVAWKDALLKHPAVRESCVPEIKTLYHEHLWKRQGYIARFLDKTKYSGDVVRSAY